ncbi:MAG: hypothetical protein QOG77_3014 [Solirubrobacteraceae bacterium]|nr:hypothetical protein [Solirubrobacteraceae bacterium]
MTVVIVVLIVWTLVAIVALALARTLCAAAARADNEQMEQRVRRPVEAPRYTTDSTSPGPASVTPERRQRVVARVLARR